MNELSNIEQTDLHKLEDVIDKGLRVFVAVGNALLEIRDRKLYREDFDNFKSYCDDRWGISRPRAYQLIHAAKVAGVLSTTVDIQPTGERQLRPLSKLDPDEQVEAWNLAVENSGGLPSYNEVRSAVREIKAPFPIQLPAAVPSEEWPFQKCPIEGLYEQKIWPDGYVTWIHIDLQNELSLLKDSKEFARKYHLKTTEVYRQAKGLETIEEAIDEMSFWQHEQEFHDVQMSWMYHFTIKEHSREGWHAWGYET